MRAALILPFAGLIFLAGYITARYSIVNRVIDSASLLIVELCNILFRVRTTSASLANSSLTWLLLFSVSPLCLS
jgi:hypothetical protein